MEAHRITDNIQQKAGDCLGNFSEVLFGRAHRIIDRSRELSAEGDYVPISFADLWVRLQVINSVRNDNPKKD